MLIVNINRSNLSKFIIFSLFIINPNLPAQNQSETYQYQVPKKLNDGWEVSSLNSVNINTNKIESITQQMITEERFENVLSMLIVKDGKLVHEAYSPYCQRNTLHVLASITKAFTSTLIGIAIEKGFIQSVNSSVLELLPQFTDQIKDPEKYKISLKHIMTMTSGLNWSEQSSYNNPINNEYQMVESEDWIQYVISRSVKEKPGARFQYNTGGIHLLSAVIKSTTNLYADQFALKYLLHPMRIQAYQWNRDPMGYPCTGGTDGGIGLRTRDIAKFGWLFLKDGTWKGKQIISPDWIKEATAKHNAKPRGMRYYAYNWFLGSMTVNGKWFYYKAAFGYGGQTLYIVPEYDLILVFTCELAEGNANVHILVQKTFKAIIN